MGCSWKLELFIEDCTQKEKELIKQTLSKEEIGGL
jgi:hypothetical protein